MLKTRGLLSPSLSIAAIVFSGLLAGPPLVQVGFAGNVANCAPYQGVYVGTFSGGDSGTFSITVSGCTATGTGFSDEDGRFAISGTVTDQGGVAASFGDATTGATWSATIVGDVISGSWVNPFFGISGTGTGFRTPTVVCGDGLRDSSEECDDGNNVDGDGCSFDCVIEFCGDGVVQEDLDEECDDGNEVDDDSCTNVCSVPEPGAALLATAALVTIALLKRNRTRSHLVPGSRRDPPELDLPPVGETWHHDVPAPNGAMEDQWQPMRAKSVACP